MPNTSHILVQGITARYLVLIPVCIARPGLVLRRNTISTGLGNHQSADYPRSAAAPAPLGHGEVGTGVRWPHQVVAETAPCGRAAHRCSRVATTVRLAALGISGVSGT